MTKRRIRDIKPGEWFTLKPIEEPKDTQVYIREEYVRSENKYICTKWADMNSSRLFKGDKEVYTDFTF